MYLYFNYAFMINRKKDKEIKQNNIRDQDKNFPYKWRLVKPRKLACLEINGASWLSKETQAHLASKDSSKTLGWSYFMVSEGSLDERPLSGLLGSIGRKVRPRVANIT